MASAILRWTARWERPVCSAISLVETPFDLVEHQQLAVLGIELGQGALHGRGVGLGDQLIFGRGLRGLGCELLDLRDGFDGRDFEPAELIAGQVLGGLEQEKIGRGQALGIGGAEPGEGFLRDVLWRYGGAEASEEAGIAPLGAQPHPRAVI